MFPLKAFKKYSSLAGDKLVALSECGNIPDMAKAAEDGAWWSCFMVWNDGDWADNGVSEASSSSNFWSGEHFNTADHKLNVYKSDIALTLDELPDITKF